MTIPTFNADGDTHHKLLLRGAVAEYLDEGDIVTFLKDLKEILVEEEDRLLLQSQWFRTAHDCLFEATPDVSEITP